MLVDLFFIKEILILPSNRESPIVFHAMSLAAETGCCVPFGAQHDEGYAT
jgi:hypothetical protein